MPKHEMMILQCGFIHKHLANSEICRNFVNGINIRTK